MRACAIWAASADGERLYICYDVFKKDPAIESFTFSEA
jgi:hypothetical protein